MPAAPFRSSAGLGQARQVIGSVAVSAFGTWAYNVGIAVYAYERTHSAAWVAAVTVGRYVPALVLSWLAGRLVDRLPRRALAITADLTCAGVMIALALLAAANAPVWLLALIAALSSTAARVQTAALLSLAADVVVESQLVRASVLAGAAEAVATAVGAAAASATLEHFASQSLFVVNAVTFVVSALVVSTVRGAPARHAARPAAAEDRPNGRSVRPFWPLQATRTVAAFVYGLDVVLLTVIATKALAAGTAGYGWLLAASGLGGLAAILPARRAEGRFTAAVTSLGVAAYCLPLILFVAATDLGEGVAVQFVRGVGSVLVSSAAISALQRSVPSTISGRVFGTTQSLVLIGTCLGAVVAPALLSVAGLTTTLFVGALVPAALQLALWPALRRFDRGQGELLTSLEPRLATLRHLDLLRDASRATLYGIADGIDDVAVAAGTVVIREGDTADAFFVLVGGSADVIADGPSGPSLLRRIDAPDYFGEIGLMRRVPRTATVTAVSDLSLWRIPAGAFLAAVTDAGMSNALGDTLLTRFNTRPGDQRRTVASVQNDAADLTRS